MVSDIYLVCIVRASLFLYVFLYANERRVSYHLHRTAIILHRLQTTPSSRGRSHGHPSPNLSIGRLTLKTLTLDPFHLELLMVLLTREPPSLRAQVLKL